MEEMVAHNKEQKAKEEGSEYTLINMIKEMLKNNATIEFVSKVTKKTPEEIKKIEESMKD